jgi:hypothetical protein
LGPRRFYPALQRAAQSCALGYPRAYGPRRPLSLAVSPSKGAAAMLKYYIYISKTKVDMLYPQIPPDFLAAAEAEVKVHLGVISTGLKSRSPEPPKELAGRTGVLADYIRNHEDVGTPDAPQTWFQAVAQLRWGVVREYASDIALFGGRVGARTVALLGSSESILGAAETSEAQHAPFYYTLRFFNGVLEGHAELARERPPNFSWRDAVDIGLRTLPKTEHQIEFLARVIHAEGDLLVGTPLYVALA